MAHPPAGAYRLRQHHPCRVNCLENALNIDTSGDLPDQDWGQTLGSQLLVDTEEVDLHHLLAFVIHPDIGRHGRNEAN